MRKISTFILTLAAIALPVGAQAAEVYNNGAPPATPNDGNDATFWIQAEDFNLAAGASLSTAGVYVGGLNGLSNWDGNVFWNIFADASGTPGTSLAAGGGLVGTVADTGIPFDCSICSGNVYLLEFGLGDFAAAAGTTYWLGIHLSTNFDRDDIYWVETDPTATSLGRESSGGLLTNWSSNGIEHAFYLTSADGAVPEPSTWAMMLLGFGATGLAIRRSRRPGLAAANA